MINYYGNTDSNNINKRSLIFCTFENIVHIIFLIFLGPLHALQGKFSAWRGTAPSYAKTASRPSIQIGIYNWRGRACMLLSTSGPRGLTSNNMAWSEMDKGSDTLIHKAHFSVSFRYFLSFNPSLKKWRAKPNRLWSEVRMSMLLKVIWLDVFLPYIVDLESSLDWRELFFWVCLICRSGSTIVLGLAAHSCWFGVIWIEYRPRLLWSCEAIAGWSSLFS